MTNLCWQPCLVLWDKGLPWLLPHICFKWEQGKEGGGGGIPNARGFWLGLFCISLSSILLDLFPIVLYQREMKVLFKNIIWTTKAKRNLQPPSFHPNLHATDVCTYISFCIVTSTLEYVCIMCKKLNSTLGQGKFRMMSCRYLPWRKISWIPIRQQCGLQVIKCALKNWTHLTVSHQLSNKCVQMF